MGCTISTNPEHGFRKPKPNETDQERYERQNKDDGTDEYFNPEEALEYATRELNITKELAKKIALRLRNADDETVSKHEVIRLWTDICQAKQRLESKFYDMDPHRHGKVTPEAAVDILKSYFTDIEHAHINKIAERFRVSGDGPVDYTEIGDFYSRLKARSEFVKSRLTSTETLSMENVKQILMDECICNERMALCICEDFDLDSTSDIDRQRLLTNINNLCV